MAFESIGGVLEGGAPVPVGGEPGDADSDEDGEGEDLHSVNVVSKELKCYLYYTCYTFDMLV